VFSILAVGGFTACVNHYYNVSMDADVQELPDAMLILKALKEDPEIIDVQYDSYPPPKGGGALFDRVFGTSGDHMSDSFSIRTRDGRQFQFILASDPSKKSVGLFQQVWQEGSEFHDDGLIHLMTDVYMRLAVRFPTLPPCYTLKKTVEHGSAH